MKNKLMKLIPDFLKPTLRKIYFSPVDIIEILKGRDSIIPPRGMNFVGDGDFEEIGQEFLQYFIDLANLQPSHKVLDVGCGIGRMAIPLTNYLSQEGEYWGFDIVYMGIKWCQKHISPKYNNFHFQHIDLYNKHFNPWGKLRAQDFQFPYGSEFFDFIFLTSVFTHMLPRDIENYLSEISRVLKPGGKCLITFFIMNDESESLVHSGRSTLDFKYKLNNYYTISRNKPESAVAFEEEVIVKMIEKHVIKINQPIHYGYWCNREKFLSYQDIVVSEKAKSL